ncbi:MAG: 2,3,4,5-tetrahydropyridine-2,6-dicarboxylate N-succinyltransferase [Myxococcaceae bacterium]|nr:2,3,4,5-tetrahydropyridine-2,6-dicarboxylate N-succinyltransferase [Myxococcaceae bacterium]
MRVENVEQFTKLVSEIEAGEGYRRPAAFAVGLATFAIVDLDRPGQVGRSAAVLDTWYPAPNCDENFGTAAILARVVGHRAGSASYRLRAEQIDEALAAFAPFEGDGKRHANLVALKQVRDSLRRAERQDELYALGETSLDRVLPRAGVVTFIGALADKPVDAHDVYLRLHLLSTRKVAPHGLSLEGQFGTLNNVVWTNVGPFLPEGFELVRGVLRSQGVEVRVQSVDKFPRMLDYVLPSGVRVADAARVRLGAYLGEGTTVMHEGFVNFNAGTLGKSMVEGRISAGVTVDDGSDVGGGASIMGTLSGGGNVVVKIGKNSLLGANSGCGIPLGDGCTIEAGLYITAGSKLRLPDGRIIKARELSGQNDLLFRRNSLNGAIEVVHKKNETVLNPELHKN